MSCSTAVGADLLEELGAQGGVAVGSHARKS